MDVTADAIYTLDEAASHLRLTNRGVAKIARRHGLCMVVGRKLLFRGSDIEAILDRLRVEPTLPRPAFRPPTQSHYQLLQSLMNLSRRKGKRQ
ncbi:MAG: DNA-binding protein [Mesorhizobium sp.]|nr:MAG: DNA-binding protein [Mesorhizobium sp.]